MGGIRSPFPLTADADAQGVKKEGRRWLRRSLIAGACYDLALAAFILLAGQSTLARLGTPVPQDAGFYFRLSALPLLLLPALYLASAAADDPDPFRPAVLWARGGGGVILAGFTLLDRPQPLGLFLGLAAADLVWWAIHARLWRGTARDGRPKPLTAAAPRP